MLTSQPNSKIHCCSSSWGIWSRASEVSVAILFWSGWWMQSTRYCGVLNDRNQRFFAIFLKIFFDIAFYSTATPFFTGTSQPLWKTYFQCWLPGHSSRSIIWPKSAGRIQEGLKTGKQKNTKVKGNANYQPRFPIMIGNRDIQSYKKKTIF